MIKAQKIKSLSFEEALKELENIVDKLNKGDCSLKEATDLYEMGILLKKHCEKQLEETEKKMNDLADQIGDRDGQK